MAIGVLGGGLSKASREEEALSVYGAELATLRRVGASENEIFITQNNLATTYQQLGRDEEAMRMLRDVYSGSMKLNGEEHPNALTAAANYAAMLGKLGRFKEARSLLHKTMAVARRVLGESHELTIKMRYNYAGALYNDAGGSLDVFREAVTTFEDLERTARRVLGGAHPLTLNIEYSLRKSRAALAIREGDDVSAARAMLDALKAA